MSTAQLLVCFGDHEVARLRRNESGQCVLSYADSWRSARGAFPLSLSMPLSAAEHGPEVVDPYLRGLLSDDEQTLRRWAKRFRVSARSSFELLTHIGRDCAGALQYLPKDASPQSPKPTESPNSPRLTESLKSPRSPHLAESPQHTRSSLNSSDVCVLTESEIAARLRALRQDPTPARHADDSGLFTLAGTQPKTALFFDGERWGLPRGRTLTTHILKPPPAGHEAHAYNEHFCLALAREVGIAAAESQILRFEDQLALVMTRYDRQRRSDDSRQRRSEDSRQRRSDENRQRHSDESLQQHRNESLQRHRSEDRRRRADAVIAVHQEDVCQALGVHPWRKAQSEGGPSPEKIVELLQAHSRRPAEDIDTFIDALAFNWLIAGTDAHAKNYSLLIGAEGQIRLAPLYDLTSSLVSPDYSVHKTRMAMKVGDTFRLRDIQKPQWSQLAANLNLDEPTILTRIHAMATALPDEAQSLLAHTHAQGLHHPILTTLATAISKRATQCARMLE